MPADSYRSVSRVHAVMVCDHCSSESHAAGYQDCPNYCTVCKDTGPGQKRKACPNRTCPDRVCSSCNSSLHKTSKSSDCPYHQCSTCDEIGHSKKHCPQVECGVCNIFGHVDTICPFQDCWDAKYPAHVSNAVHDKRLLFGRRSDCRFLGFVDSDKVS
jgi:hypothetical protein